MSTAIAVLTLAAPGPDVSRTRVTLAVVLAVLVVAGLTTLVRALRRDQVGGRTPPVSHRSWEHGTALDGLGRPVGRGVR